MEAINLVAANREGQKKGFGKLPFSAKEKITGAARQPYGQYGIHGMRYATVEQFPQFQLH
jgi:hypothetical protein